ncbi:flotillin domain-containing protein [Ponticaulis sp.]|uniref:flotillin family protein n=1 Tax=Ponticaulis sp. TaxID=2020902 RepID=UPI000C57AD89|nr:flotillin domain-containing protein [Ponticaulis sp.]MAJ10666.1 flotillin [Ponticaulis sp.]HBH89035.1 flotillin [Hyphomonadaceae bacterium]
MESWTYYGTIAGAVVLLFIVTGFVLARLFRRASKEVSFVRTGFGGQKVIMNGGALVYPILHEIIPVNMNTLRLEVRRHHEQALITRDRMRVDVQAEFYVRVQPTLEAVANAAQTLGRRTMQPEHLRELIEGKFVDALRAVAAEMAMEELHEQRVAFVQKVQAAVSEDILKNGLELESVSLTGLDQTSKEYFNPDNAFDAEGLTKLTMEIEARRKKRNDIEQETEVEIQLKNLDAEQRRLQISRDSEYANLEQQREVEVRRAGQSAQIAQEQAERRREAEQATIVADRQVKESAIAADRVVQEQDIQKDQAVEAAQVEKEKQIELARQDRDIAIAEKSRANSEADAEADRARAIAAKAAEEVVTSRETEIAERDKAIELIEAKKIAEQQAIAIKVAAETEKSAAADKAEAVRVEADAHAARLRIEAQGDADAEKLRAEALEAVYRVEAEGKRAVNEAANVLSPEQIAMQIKQALIESLPAIIEQSVKPMEAIDSIKILNVEGLNGVANGAGGGGSAEGGSVADQAVSAALKYRAQAPLLDSLMAELGLKGDALNHLTGAVNGSDKPASDA